MEWLKAILEASPLTALFLTVAVRTERPDIGYAMIFPSVTVVKILFVQIVAALLGG